MIHSRLRNELEMVAERCQRLRLWTALAAAWLFTALIGAAIWAVGSVGGFNVVAVLCGIALLLAFVGAFVVRMKTPGYDWIAHRVEETYPELRTCLLAAVEQQPDLPNGRYGYLQSGVIRQALEHAAVNPWRRVVSRRRMATAVLANFAAFGLFLGALALTAFWTAPPLSASGEKARPPLVEGGRFTVTVEPGNTEVERGTSLLVLARIDGGMPPDSVLVYQSPQGEPVRLTMVRSLADPIFGVRIPAVKEPLDYHIELGDQVTPTYRATVFEYPRLERLDLRLVSPQYTGMEPRVVQDVRTVSVVEGTAVTVQCRLNKTVASAKFTEEKGEPLVLAQEKGERPDYSARFTATVTRRLKLELIDEAGRKNVQQTELVVQVVPNQPPTLKPVLPARDVEVSALEELDVKATVWDDIGVQRMGVSYSIAGSEPVDVVLDKPSASKPANAKPTKGADRQRHELAKSIRLEELRAEPDQLLSYFFWAEDFGPDGALRRTSSDMYFAEVRPWDEIFRQGEQPPGGQQQQRQQQQQQQQGMGQNAQAAQQLAQLQKDVINATWKVIRREIGDKLTPSFAEDVEQIAQSQSAALEQAQGLAEQVKDEQSQEHVAAVLLAMQQAITHLQSAKDKPAAAPLKSALAAEQSAYQGLLRLRAREHEVVRQQQQQQQQSSSSSASRSQQQRQQLEQLDLSKEENRYEAERTAQDAPPETPEDRETRQVLNRLRELAQRQHDVNERLKDLQSALQEAPTPERREELQRQLQRLQEEQQQVLRDTDELASRMETPENQERMSQERQQLDETRDQVQKTAEAMEQQQVTQAAASGTRAEEKFEDLRNEFRRRASGAFNDQMRQMRESARDLDRREQELSQQLKQAVEPAQGEKTLREENKSEKIAEGLSEQRKRLNTLIEEMKKTIQEAEQHEPLLAEKLYDTARSIQDKNVEETLQSAERSARQGLAKDAQEQEAPAGRGIAQLKEGIERAAESVLGDETEALRRAREELRKLSEQLNQEIARNNPDAPRVRSPRPDQPMNSPPSEEGAGEGENPPPRRNPEEQDPNQQPSTGQRPGQSSPGEQPPEKPQPGEGQGNRPPGQQPQPGERQPGANGRRPGERQPGEQQPGQPQPGERQPGERQPGANGRQPGERQPGEQQPGEQPGERQPGQQPGQQPGGQQPGGQQPGEQPPDGQQPRGQQTGTSPAQGGTPQRGAPNGPRRLGAPQGGGNPQGGDDPRGPMERTGERGPRDPNQNIEPPARDAEPIAGDDFREWSDRLRDVEEMVDDPELRAEAARIRDRARAIRAEVKRHSKAPNWDVVRVNVAEPLVELADRVAQELQRRNSKQALVPLDRDPVPPKYSEKTRRYYEQLGTGK